MLISLYHASHPSLHGRQAKRLTGDVFYSPFRMHFIHFLQKGHPFIAFSLCKSYISYLLHYFPIARSCPKLSTFNMVHN